MTTLLDPSGLSIATLGVSSGEAWDDHVRQHGGHLLQSWRWGEFKRRHGWDAERVFVAADGQLGMAQVLFRHVGPFSIGYIPRGPVVSASNAGIARNLFGAVDQTCQAKRALHLIVEPDGPLPYCGRFKTEGFVRGPEHFQPARTVHVPLADDEELLRRMHTKTRYSVRLAQRRGVRIARQEITDQAMSLFYGLLLDTSLRNAFGIHDVNYYSDFLRIFEGDAVLLFAFVDDRLAAGLIAAKFGQEAIYMYGASSTEHRAHGAAFLLQFEAMRWARAAGCLRYDLWGIPVLDPDKTAADSDRIAATRGEDGRGLYRFKVGFGGYTVTYPVTLERRYRPVLSFIARRRYGRHD